jgi:hypothetical protein
VPEWLIPVLTIIAGGVGGYIGAVTKIAVLELQMREVLEWKSKATEKLSWHNEDLLIHDVEIQTLCNKSEIPRALRQRTRRDE